MNVLQWFKDRIGKHVHAKHTTAKGGFIKITSPEHAAHLHATQSARNYSFHDHGHQEDGDFLTSMAAGMATDSVLFGFAAGGNIAGAVIGQEIGDAQRNDPAPDFGGGATDGAGAGGSWNGSPSSGTDYSSGSDF